MSIRADTPLCPAGLPTSIHPRQHVELFASSSSFLNEPRVLIQWASQCAPSAPLHYLDAHLCRLDICTSNDKKTINGSCCFSPAIKDRLRSLLDHFIISSLGNAVLSHLILYSEAETPVRRSSGYTNYGFTQSAVEGLAVNILALTYTHTHRGRLAWSVMECGHNGVTVAMETGGGFPCQAEPFPLCTDSSLCLSASCSHSLGPPHALHAKVTL